MSLMFILGGEMIQNCEMTYPRQKIIITFNGTLFDIPFLRKEFESINIPAVHIDLRYFSPQVRLAWWSEKD